MLLEFQVPEPPPLPNQGPNFLYITDDPDRDWPIVGPYAIYTMNSYAKWGAERGTGATLYSNEETLATARTNPIFQFVTPEHWVLALLRKTFDQAPAAQALKQAGALGEALVESLKKIRGGKTVENEKIGRAHV